MSRGNMKTMDGNTAAAHVAYAFTDVAAIYPITPSSNMAEQVDEWAAYGRKNIFGQTVRVAEMQSEAGAAGAVHGSLAQGALTTTFTASQGLLLMIPNMYKISGELLPGVFHVAARAIASHALSIFGDHSDIAAANKAGFAILASSSVQEVMDLAAVAHLSAIKSRVPFIHFFDGFRTSHEIQKIDVLDYNDLSKLLDWDSVKAFRDRCLNPDNPVVRGTAQNPDIFFQAKEAAGKYYEAVPGIVIEYMEEIGKLTGRHYSPFDYVGHKAAEHIIVAMGSSCETIEETVDLMVKEGEKVGLIKVRLYRPFIKELFLKALPKTVKKIAVLDRVKDPGALGEPLYQDVKTALYDSKVRPEVYGGRYGLGSKDFAPGMVTAVFENLNRKNPKNGFTVGIEDDVYKTSLPYKEGVSREPEGTVRCKFWGIGSDGTVGANQTAIKIIGDKTDMYAQGYFAYDSKKSGGVTISHLRFGKSPIKSTYFIREADFVACHAQAYLTQYDMLRDLKEGGTFLLNCSWSKDELSGRLPDYVKKELAEKNIRFYIIDAYKAAEELGLGNRINMIMQAAFFNLTKVIPLNKAVKYLKEGIDEAYGKKGQKVLDMNYKAVDLGIKGVVEIPVPSEWKKIKVKKEESCYPEFIQNVLVPMNRQEGDSLPVSTFVGREDGTFPMGTSKYEKRGVAMHIPQWIPENCIQCGQCSFVCPHAAIRVFVLDEEEAKRAPSEFVTIPSSEKAFKGQGYRIQVSPLDCMGCGNCADICLAKDKALVMKPFEEVVKEAANWEFSETVSYKADKVNKNTIKGSQFAFPYMEFSGACAGCGETPYIKLITQLYGDRMIIANATGCSSIWGASAPSMPYCTDKDGRGPAWANSLFEDNAEYGYGMVLASKQIREGLVLSMNELLDLKPPKSVKEAISLWIEGKDKGEGTRERGEALRKALIDFKPEDKKVKKLKEEILEKEEYFVKPSVWAVGGDGWAYDIGYGGLDHVLASGENINVLVFDTEVYSNTGGQASKATPEAAVAKFAASGMSIKKKDLGRLAMTYGYVYVAQVGMGADKNQLLKAVTEAESYDGPSLIIAYSPCINHGIIEGMNKSQESIKKAVDSGYWHLYRYNPMKEALGENPFTLDSKEPKMPFREFLLTQNRYASLLKEFPEEGEKLFEASEKSARERYVTYKRMAEEGPLFPEKKEEESEVPKEKEEEPEAPKVEE